MMNTACVIVFFRFVFALQFILPEQRPHDFFTLYKKKKRKPQYVIPSYTTVI
jgi:hypothetical protein